MKSGEFSIEFSEQICYTVTTVLEVLEGAMPSKQLKMLLGWWAAFHQEELRENWELAREQQELFSIEPLK